MPRPLVIVCIFLYVLYTSQAGRIVEITTDGTMKMKLMNDHGVPVSGFNTLLFDLKACSNAIFVLSETSHMTKKHSKYFMVMFGASKTKRLNGIKDSCFKCSTFRASAIATTVSCDHFKSFFVRWDNKGYIGIGTGKDANDLQRVFLEYKSHNSFSINFLNIMSLKHKATWRFRVDSEPKATTQEHEAIIRKAPEESKNDETKKTKGSCEKVIKELKKKAEEDAKIAKEKIHFLEKQNEKIEEDARTAKEKLVEKFKGHVKAKEVEKTPKSGKRTKDVCQRRIHIVKKKSEEETRKAKNKIYALKKLNVEIKEMTRTAREKLAENIKELVVIMTDEILSKLGDLRI